MRISTISDFIKYLESVRGRTMKVIEEIPPTQVDWRPSPSSFSFADIIRHIAAMEYHTWAKIATFQISTYGGHDNSLADGYNDVVEYLNQMHTQALQLFKAITDENLQQKCTTPAGVNITLWKWLRAWFEHEIHHRGQIYTYLRLIETESPPIYGLTSEQVRENSINESS